MSYVGQARRYLEPCLKRTEKANLISSPSLSSPLLPLILFSPSIRRLQGEMETIQKEQIEHKTQYKQIKSVNTNGKYILEIFVKQMMKKGQCSINDR